MADARNCEVGTILAELNIGYQSFEKNYATFVKVLIFAGYKQQYGGNAESFI
jgi:hypothetical protein